MPTEVMEAPPIEDQSAVTSTQDTETEAPAQKRSKSAKLLKRSSAPAAPKAPKAAKEPKAPKAAKEPKAPKAAKEPKPAKAAKPPKAPKTKRSGPASGTVYQLRNVSDRWMAPMGDTVLSSHASAKAAFAAMDVEMERMRRGKGRWAPGGYIARVVVRINPDGTETLGVRGFD